MNVWQQNYASVPGPHAQSCHKWTDDRHQAERQNTCAEFRGTLSRSDSLQSCKMNFMVIWIEQIPKARWRSRHPHTRLSEPRRIVWLREAVQHWAATTRSSVGHVRPWTWGCKSSIYRTLGGWSKQIYRVPHGRGGRLIRVTGWNLKWGMWRSIISYSRVNARKTRRL